MHQIRFRLRLRWGALLLTSNPLAEFQESTSKGREGKIKVNKRERKREKNSPLCVPLTMERSTRLISRLYNQAGSTSWLYVSWTSQLDVCSMFNGRLLNGCSMSARCLLDCVNGV